MPVDATGILHFGSECCTDPIFAREDNWDSLRWQNETLAYGLDQKAICISGILGGNWIMKELTNESINMFIIKWTLRKYYLVM